MIRTSLAILVLGAAFAAPGASAQASQAPRTYVLVSAVGGTFTFTRQHKQTGSSIDADRRHERAIPGTALDAAVLRGLERIVREEEPGAEFVYMRLDPAELDGAWRYQRGEVALGKLATALERVPGREKWHRILAVTPRYMNSGREGLGDKLHGIGLYVRNAERLPANNDNYTRPADETRAPDGTPGRSDRWIAPYFYAQVSVIDPKTMRVLETSERWDFEKLFDPRSSSFDVEADFPPEVLGARLERFVELSTADALRELFGTVTVSEPRVVPESRK